MDVHNSSPMLWGTGVSACTYSTWIHATHKHNAVHDCSKNKQTHIQCVAHNFYCSHAIVSLFVPYPFLMIDQVYTQYCRYSCKHGKQALPAPNPKCHLCELPQEKEVSAALTPHTTVYQVIQLLPRQPEAGTMLSVQVDQIKIQDVLQFEPSSTYHSKIYILLCILFKHG